MKVMTFERFLNFNRCSFKRLNILLLILIFAYMKLKTVVSRTRLYSSILLTAYFILDFAQPIHFAEKERVYEIFCTYVFTSGSLKEAHALYIYSRFVVGSVLLVLCLVYPMLPVSLDCLFG